ncbi:hypothetical protein Ciccas_014591 [Cichlidogyrus casuarinus]|uniref:Uncharacterized protein n=1 Tax=Cichlidogyrus casuarinus TaxID=1844966 RepID=A0ABD2PIY5_9PLAT
MVKNSDTSTDVNLSNRLKQFEFEMKELKNEVTTLERENDFLLKKVNILEEKLRENDLSTVSKVNK